MNDGEDSAEERAQNPMSIDDHCLSCSLEKYRPVISEAFKMACVQYKPGPVSFLGTNYDRKSLVNLKRNMIEEICKFKLYKNQFYKIYTDKRGGTTSLDPFLQGLAQRLKLHGRVVEGADHMKLEFNVNDQVLD